MVEFIALINLRSVFLFLGNPGFSAFYVPFAKALYSAVNRRFPVWVISHAGHALAPKDKRMLTSLDGMSLLTSTFLYSELGAIVSGKSVKIKNYYTNGNLCLWHQSYDTTFW